MSKEALKPNDLAAYTPPSWEMLPDLGLYMDQVITYLDQKCRTLYPDGRVFITPAMINNYVKSSVISRPDGKKYSRDLLAQLVMLCTIKPASSLEELKKILAPAAEQTIETLYRTFCVDQARVFSDVISRKPQSSALQLALEASICTLLCDQQLQN